jgi:hypothetical protein
VLHCNLSLIIYQPKRLFDRSWFKKHGTKARHALLGQQKKYTASLDKIKAAHKDLKDLSERQPNDIPVKQDLRSRSSRYKFDPERCDEIRNCFRSLHNALESRLCSCGCATAHRAAVNLDWTSLNRMSGKRSFKVAISYESSLNSHAWRQVGFTQKLKASRVRFVTPADTTENDGQNAQRTHLTDLCEILRQNSIPWTVFGTLDPRPGEEQHQTFDLESSTERGIVTKAVPVRSLPLGHIRGPERPRDRPSMSLQQRLGIAVSIAWAVLHLSNSPWLGEHWDEDQLSIFVTQAPGDNPDFSKHPSASVSFKPLQQGNQPAVSEATTAPSAGSTETQNLDILAIVRRQIPNQIVFALGILLMELALNRPFTWYLNQAGRSSDTLLDRFTVAGETIDEVYELVHEDYADAVRLCIGAGGAFSGRNLDQGFGSPAFRREFFDCVVVPVMAAWDVFQGR